MVVPSHRNQRVTKRETSLNKKVEDKSGNCANIFSCEKMSKKQKTYSCDDFQFLPLLFVLPQEDDVDPVGGK